MSTANALKDKPVNKEVRQKLYYARKNWPENLKKYSRKRLLVIVTVTQKLIMMLPS
jgi:hypothetical protein